MEVEAERKRGGKRERRRGGEEERGRRREEDNESESLSFSSITSPLCTGKVPLLDRFDPGRSKAPIYVEMHAVFVCACVCVCVCVCVRARVYLLV